MTSSLRHALISIAIVVIAFLAHGGLLQAGFLGDDLALLRESRGLSASSGASATSYWSGAGFVRPVPTLVLRVDAAAQGPDKTDDRGRATELRVVALAVLLIGAMTGGFALRRALLPWVGGDTARAAAFACALFVAVHPLAGAALARPRALGELFVWLFGALAAFLFLRGRQMREKGFVVAAGGAAILAGFSGVSAWIVPFVLAALELGSARRPRPFAERARTAATTFLVFTACVFVESAVAAAAGARITFTSGFPNVLAWSSPMRALATSVEKLGLLFFPITGGTLARNWPSYLVCIAIVFIALWPVLRSARVAPRLWGSLASAWIVAMFLALVSQAGVRVAPNEGSYADVLFIAAAFAASGLAVATTSLLGTRRIVLPALIAIGFSWLSMRAAHSYASATEVVDQMCASVAVAQRAVGDEGRVVVVDPPSRILGLDLALLRALESSRASAVPAPIFLPAGAFPFLTRTRSFAAWRKHGIALLEHDGRPLGRLSLSTSPPIVGPTQGTKQASWRGESRSPLFDLDPALVRFASVQALPGTSSAEAPRMAWRASEPAGEWVVTTGVWIENEKGLIAVFDPWRHDAWWTASTIRRVRAEDPLVNVASFELLEDLALEIDGQKPRTDHTDWIFDVREDRLARPLRGDALFVLEIFALGADGSVSFAEFPCESSSVNGVRSLRAPGAAGFVAALEEHDSPEVEWSLERRVGEVVIARTSGISARSGDHRAR